MKTIGVGIEGVGVFKVALMGLLCLLCEVTRLAGRAPNRGAGKNPMYLSSSTKDKTIQYTRLNHSLSNACVERGNCQSVEGGRRSATETQEFGRALAIRSNLISVLADWPPPGLVELSTRRSEEKKKGIVFSFRRALASSTIKPVLAWEMSQSKMTLFLIYT